jgi:type III restriction enzyme
LQEVGRGLRLPVDENGNRISNEEFWLNYIVDFTEFDFAEQLVKQINGELPQDFGNY